MPRADTRALHNPIVTGFYASSRQLCNQIGIGDALGWQKTACACDAGKAILLSFCLRGLSRQKILGNLLA